MSNHEAKRAELRKSALEYHEFPTPGKVAIAATKPLLNQHDRRLPIRQVSPPPARRSLPTRATPTAIPRAATWWRW